MILNVHTAVSPLVMFSLAALWSSEVRVGFLRRQGFDLAPYDQVSSARHLMGAFHLDSLRTNIPNGTHVTAAEERENVRSVD